MIKKDVVDVIELGVLIAAWARSVHQKEENKLAYKAIREKLARYGLDDLEIPIGDFEERLQLVGQLKTLFHKMGKHIFAKGVLFGSLIAWYSSSTKKHTDIIIDLADELDIPPKSIQLFLKNKESVNSDTEELIILNWLDELREMSKSLRIFLGYGHNYILMQKVENFLRRNGYDIFTLDNANNIKPGARIIELLEIASKECNCAVILFTKDDEIESAYRPRQNVVHELGFFQGKFGRDNVILLVEEGTQIFSNISGILYIKFDPNHINSKFYDLNVMVNKIESEL